MKYTACQTNMANDQSLRKVQYVDEKSETQNQRDKWGLEYITKSLRATAGMGPVGGTD